MISYVSLQVDRPNPSKLDSFIYAARKKKKKKEEEDLR